MRSNYILAQERAQVPQGIDLKWELVTIAEIHSVQIVTFQNLAELQTIDW